MSLFDFNNPYISGEYSYGSYPLENFDFYGGIGQTSNNAGAITPVSSQSWWDSIQNVFDTGLSIAGDIIGMENAWDNRASANPWVQTVAQETANTNAAAHSSQAFALPPTIAGIKTSYVLMGGLALAATFIVMRKK